MLEPERIVSHYQVRHVLGRGGMGTVFLARDVRLGRRVALKVVERLSGADPDAFLREARLTALVNHPNIVAVYDVGEVDGRPWVALEYVEGQPLRAAMSDERMPPMRAIRLSQPVASALAAAHAAGIIHRDLKPENIVLGTDGRPRVLDFGLALWTTDPDDVGAPVAGTPAYIAPECWRSETTTSAADVWALGVMLFELLSGRHPWAAELERGTAAIRAVVSSVSAAPVLPDEADLPPGLTALVTRCLAPEPGDRPTAAEVADGLERLLHRAPVDEDVCPFRGLLPYEAEHASWFFGRDADVGALVERIEAQPRLALVGPSGVGKSSLIHAGVVPRLRERGWWILVTLRPGPTPLATLARVVQRRLDSAQASSVEPARSTASFGSGSWYDDDDLLDGSDAGEDVAGAEAAEEGDVLGASLAAELISAPGRLGVVLQEIAQKRLARVLLVVDQLEEIETQGVPPVERAAFLAALASAAQDPSDSVRLVVTVRDDHLGRLAAAGGHALLQQVEVVRPLDRAGLGAVLNEPLLATGHRFDDPTLVDEMIDAVQAEPGALPLLQFTARRLWDLRDRNRRVLRRADHDALGGVAGALARHAEDVVRQVPAQDRGSVRVLLLRLVNDDGTRRLAGYDTVVEGMEPAQTAVAIRERLVAARLLVVREGEGGARTLELAHESLAVRWDRLRRWRTEARDEVRVLADVEEAARLWDRRGRPDEGLWGGPTLDEARRTLTDGAVGLTELGAGFLASSETRDRRARSLRRRLVFGAVAASFLVTVGSVGVAVAYGRQRAQAVSEADAAADARGLALVSSAQAAWQAGDHLEARARLRAGFERLDSAAARALWTQIRHDPLLWHQEETPASFQVQPSRDGSHAVVASAGGLLRVVALDTAHTKTLRVASTDFAAAALTDDLRRVVGLRYDGSMVRWELEEDRWEDSPLLPAGQTPTRAWFAADGRLVVHAIAEAGRLGTLWLADPLHPDKLVSRVLPEGHTLATVSSDLRRLTTSGQRTRVVTLWTLDPELAPDVEITLPEGVDAEWVQVRDDGALIAVFGPRPVLLDRQGSVVRELPARDVRVRGGGFVDGGHGLLAVGDDGSVVTWDVDTGKQRAVLPHGVPATTIHGAVTASSGLLVFSHLYGFGALDVAAMVPPAQEPGHTGRLDGVAVSPDGAWVASGGSDARVVLRDAATGRQVAAVDGLGGAVNAVRFAPSGRLLAAAVNAGTAAVFTVPELTEVVRVPHGDDVVAAELLDDVTLRTMTWSGAVRDVRFDGPLPVTLASWELGAEAYDLRVAPDGSTLVAFTDGRVVRLDARGEPGPPLLVHDDATHSLAVARGVVASAGFDDTIRVTVPAVVIAGFTDGRVALSQDGAQLAYPGPGGGLVVRTLASGEQRTLPRVVVPVDAVAFGPDGVIVGTGRGGSVMAWEGETGVPRWRGVALSVDPPAALSHQGWTRLGGGVPATTWAPDLAGSGWRADLSGGSACVLTVDGHVRRWEDGELAPKVEALAGNARDVVLLGHGCAVLDDEGLRWVAPGDVDRRLGPARGVARRDDRVEALDGQLARVWVGEAEEVDGWRVPPGATVALAAGGTTCSGFPDGQVLCDDRPALRGTPSAAVTVANPWRDDLVLLGFADGVAGVWSTTSGAPLLRAKLDGAIVRLVAAPGAVLALTATGDARRLETTTFELPWCDVLHEVVTDVPVTWAGEEVVHAPALQGPCSTGDAEP